MEPDPVSDTGVVFARSLLKALARLHNLRQQLKDYEEKQTILQQKIKRLEQCRSSLLDIIGRAWSHELHDLRKLASKLHKVAPELHEDECLEILARKRYRHDVNGEEPTTSVKRKRVQL